MSGEALKIVKIGHGRYTVSNDGMVFSLGKPLKLLKGPKGYLRVGLYHEGKRVTMTVAKIVAEAFIGTRPIGHHIAHSDGDKTNNRVSNLRYCTPKENEADKRRHGASAIGIRHHRAKLTPDQVILIRSEYRSYSREFSSRALARRFGVSGTTIHDILSGKTWGEDALALRGGKSG